MSKVKLVSQLTGYEIAECVCPYPYEMTDDPETWVAVGNYLEELTARVRSGKVRHMSVSVHPRKAEK